MEKERSFLVFSEGNSYFGIKLSDVDRVEKSCKLQRLSQQPDFLKGILNYHGATIPILDIRNIFLLPQRQDKLSDLIVIAHTETRQLGIWVEQVEGVVEKSTKEVREAQRLFLGLDYVKGVFCYADQMVVLSDIDKLVSENELKKLHKVLTQKSKEA